MLITHRISSIALADRVVVIDSGRIEDDGTHDELIAHRLTVEQMTRELGADSLAFLSLEGMMRAVGREEGYCQACFTGDYPLDLSHDRLKTGFGGAIGG